LFSLVVITTEETFWLPSTNLPSFLFIWLRFTMWVCTMQKALIPLLVKFTDGTGHCL